MNPLLELASIGSQVVETDYAAPAAAEVQTNARSSLAFLEPAGADRVIESGYATTGA